MAEKSSLSSCTSTVETPNSIDASGSIETSCCRTVIDVLRTIGTNPAVDTNAVVASMGVCTSGSILADGWPGRRFFLLGVSVIVKKAKRKKTIERI